MNIRKKDYIIFYVITILLYGMNIMSPVKIHVIFALVILGIFPALVLGTITNFIFRKK